MKSTIFRSLAVLLLAALIAAPGFFAAGATVALPDQRFTDAELDELLAPIALYPDPLLAQVVPASTFIDQLEEAARALGGKSDDSLIGNQNWDVSVKSVAHYPQVLQMMVEKRDWTTALGQAYVNQSTDVGKSIQRLRAEAKAAGNLESNSQQSVTTEGQVIKIEPAQPQVIYVPQYNPQVVYVEQSSGVSTGTAVAAAAISFGVGMAIGAWLNNDWDYYGRGIYYHGWVGGGWVGVNRTYVNVNRNVYVNNRYNNINVNRNINNRNINNYRTQLNRNATVRQQNITRNNINRNNINRNNVARNDINRNNVNRNDINRNNINRNNATRNNVAGNDALRNRDQNRDKFESYRGHNPQGTANRADSGSAFGGGGNRAQIQQQRDRGNSSLQHMNADRGGSRSGGNSSGTRERSGGARAGGGARRGRKG